MPSNGRLAPAQRLRREIYSLVADFLEDVAAGNVKDIATAHELAHRAGVYRRAIVRGYYGREVDPEAAKTELAFVAREMRARLEGRKKLVDEGLSRTDPQAPAARSTRNGRSSRSTRR
jgi:hypothetical protein